MTEQRPNRDDRNDERDAAPGGSDRSGLDTSTKVMLGSIAVAAAVVMWFFGVAVIPRWWAQRVGNVVDGRLSVGSVAGLTVGALFVVVPGLVLGASIRFARKVTHIVVAAAVAIVVAAPNWATLGIVIGDGSAAHAGERILDVDGPGFRGGSLVGAIVGAVAVFWVAYLAWSRRRYRHKLAAARD